MSGYAELYEVLEQRLQSLLETMKGRFTIDEIQEVNALIGAREYGLALETIAGITLARKDVILPHILEDIEKLASLMDIDAAFFLAPLYAVYQDQQDSRVTH
jgi:hypothetical protein